MVDTGVITPAPLSLMEIATELAVMRRNRAGGASGQHHSGFAVGWRK